MANNQAGDMYDPPGIGQNDFDEHRFEDIEDEDLFWLNQQNSDSNAAYRKMNDTQGYNTKTGIVENFQRMQIVFQRS